MRTIRRSLLAAAALCLAAAEVAFAQTWPTKPVRLIVPFATGGASDTFARVVAPALSERLGQPVLVENKPGAGGTVAAAFVAQSPADGYVALVGDVGTHGIAPSLYPSLPYDPLKDFDPVNLSLANPLVLVTSPSLAAGNLRELLTLAKARSGQLYYSSAGNGGIVHLAAEMLKSMAAVNITHVPYKGGATGVTAVLSGDVQMTIPAVATAQPHIKAGKLRAIAVTGSKRSKLLPDVPTMQEAGLTGYVVDPWVGVLVPAGTPKVATERLQRELSLALNRPEVAERLATIGFEIINGTPDQFQELMRNEIEKWRRIVKTADVRPG